MRSRRSRWRHALVLAACISLVLTVPVLGHTSATITPSSQIKASGQSAFFQVSWNGSGSTQVILCPGDGSSCPVKTTTTNTTAFSHTFYSCVSTSFNQTAYVTQGGHTRTDNSVVHVQGGPLC